MTNKNVKKYIYIYLLKWKVPMTIKLTIFILKALFWCPKGYSITLSLHLVNFPKKKISELDIFCSIKEAEDAITE